MLQAHTLNRKAFDLFNSATIKVATYYRTLDSAILDRALADLNKSIEFDPDYFQPLNYKGIVFDLKGSPSQAINEFNSIYNQKLSEGLRPEVEYNRAVANYHLYHEPNMIAAIAELSSVINNPSNNIRILALAKASLAQAYGMMVLHAQKHGEEKVLKYFNLTVSSATEAIKFIEKHKHDFDKSFFNNAIWIAYNAEGIGLMFLDDLKLDPLTGKNEKIKENLTSAVARFKKGMGYSSPNWALTCNRASANMRLGHLYKKEGKPEKSAEYFGKAIELLNEVINHQRPNYDFALYELGRIYRFQSDMEKAITLFERAKIAGGDNPNISKEILDQNIERARSGHTDFIIA
ncbi:tetratricopeptide repeat protein [Pedobacter jejuensis]|uniref:Tetratricopeptide repeat protein n=1 Tax=Pedobacter jejuensis TaxID=1268550 RepID=A0A3N0BUS8_9SPHI|nr:tetratricopeptide repeat protein [Pedobacter jejuensis]RNL53140.1 tetratricopeptide repeat protein [Pedobacter jejuensis]